LTITHQPQQANEALHILKRCAFVYNRMRVYSIPIIPISL
jgi:hypothetical protein